MSMAQLCACIKQALLDVLFVLFLPLIILEVILLMLFGVRLPPLSCMVNKPPLSGAFDRASLPPHPPVPEKLLNEKEDVKSYGLDYYRTKGDATEAVKTTCEIMLAYNTIPSTLECPDDLQGIFWMDGNKVPEELVCLSYASWDSDKTLLTKVNGTLAWSYLDSSIGRFISWFQEKAESSGMQYCQFEGSDLKEGRFYAATTYKYEDFNWLSSIAEFSMERLDEPGVNYKRGCYWFNTVFGRRLDVGSYTLRKIMHTDKTPVQPAYDDFVKYMASKKGIGQLMEAPPTGPDGEPVEAVVSA